MWHSTLCGVLSRDGVNIISNSSAFYVLAEAADEERNPSISVPPIGTTTDLETSILQKE